MLRTKLIIIAVISCIAFLFSGVDAAAQCSICTKTAQQMGEGPAKALNMGIVYLMLTPFAVVGLIIFRWWKNNRN